MNTWCLHTFQYGGEKHVWYHFSRHVIPNGNFAYFSCQTMTSHPILPGALTECYLMLPAVLWDNGPRLSATSS